MHAGGMQLTDMTQGVLPQPAHHLRESDSQAPPGLSAYWLYMASHSLHLIPGGPLPAWHFSFQVNMLKGSRTGEQGKVRLRRVEGFWFKSLNADVPACK